ncbi:MAG: hypothetical protein IH945_11965 [Armatimonadetes bacterium]|nr:hypothetical protein [Armatimonadota bacterium]
MDALNRCWLGFPLPPEVSELVKQAQLEIKRRAGSDGIRWKPPGEIAVLLVSLGEVSPRTLALMEQAVGPAAGRHAPISLRLEGAGGSPNLTMPRSAWLGITGEVEALKSLQRDLAACTGHLSSTTDHTEFEPTIEIGRLRRFEESARTEMGRSLRMSKIGVLGEFTLDSVHVLCSEATSSGPSLRSITSYQLRAPGG